MKRAIYVIIFTYLTCICFCIPSYFTFTIKSRQNFPMEMEYCGQLESNELTPMSEIDRSTPMSELDRPIFPSLSKLETKNDSYFNENNLDKKSFNDKEINKKLNNNYNNSNFRSINKDEFKKSKRFDTINKQLDELNSSDLTIMDKLINDKKISKKLNHNSTINSKHKNKTKLLLAIKDTINRLIRKFENQYPNTTLTIKDFYQWLNCCNFQEFDRSEVLKNFQSQICKFLSDNNDDLPKIFPKFKNKSSTYIVTFSDIALKYNGLLKKINFWVYSVLNKLIPCLSLTYLSLALIKMLYQSNERRSRLRSYGQAQTFYSQAASSSFYNTNPIVQNQLPLNKKDDSGKELPLNTSNSTNFLNLNQYHTQNGALITKSTTANLTPLKINESISSININNNSLSALSPSKSQLKLNIQNNTNSINTECLKQVDQLNKNDNKLNSSTNKLRSSLNKDSQNSDLNKNSNQSLNQPLNLSSRNNSNTSFIYPNSFLNTSSSFNNNNKSCKLNNNTNCDRTTRMLIAILILFLITEFPSGLLNLLAAVSGESFINNIYVNLGEVIDLLALINNGVNFILYCTMSRQFRKTFQKTFCCNCICFFKPINKASAAAILLNTKTGIQLNLNSIPNQKANSMNVKLNQTNNLTKKIASEIDDDDQELVTMNETKQNSSTIEMDDDYLINCSQDNLNNSNRLSKSSLKQETILECKENFGDNCTDESIDNDNNIFENNKKLIKSESLQNYTISRIKTLNTSSIVNSNNSNEHLDNDKNVIKDELDSNSKKIINNNLTRLRIHRNSSIDSSNSINNFENRKNKSLHRHNDSRRHRYRRKTIANVENSDLKNSSLSTCV